MFHFCLHLFIFVFCVFFLGQFFCWTCFLCNFVSTLFLFCLVFSNQKGRIFFLYNCFFYVTVQKKNLSYKKASSNFYIVLRPCSPDFFRNICDHLWASVFYFCITAAKAYYSVRFPLSCCHDQNESSVHCLLASLQNSLCRTNRQSIFVKSACLVKSITNSS